MAKRLGRVPIPGAVVEEFGWRLTAEQGGGRRHRIGTVLLEPTKISVVPTEESSARE